MSGLSKTKLGQVVVRWLMKWAEKQLTPALMRDRESCCVCGKPIDYREVAPGWYNVDISKRQCSWHPFCEVVICSECVEKDSEKCAKHIMAKFNWGRNGQG